MLDWQSNAFLTVNYFNQDWVKYRKLHQLKTKQDQNPYHQRQRHTVYHLKQEKTETQAKQEEEKTSTYTNDDQKETNTHTTHTNQLQDSTETKMRLNPY